MAVAVLPLVGCASTYDPELVERRSKTLFAPRPEGASSPSGGTPTVSDGEPPELVDDSGLADYVAFGLAHSAELRAAFEDWRALTERVAQESALPAPRLSYVEFLEEVQTRTGPQERRFGLSQAFPWPGELDQRATVAERRAEARWYQVEEVRLAVSQEIELAYQDYAFLGEEQRITDELLELLRGLEPIVQSQVAAGRGQADILRLQVEIGRLEDELASVERRRPARSARLAAALDLELAAGELLPIPRLEEPATVPIEAARARELAFAQNPVLLRLREEIELARANEGLAAYRRKPSFSVGIDAILTGDAPGTGVSGSGDDPLLVGLSVGLPIWTTSYAAAEREARHVLRAAEARLDGWRTALVAEVEEIVFHVDDATRKLSLYRDSLIPRASEALELTLSSYRAGEATVLDLIDSERALLEFERSFWRACRDRLQGEARLRSVTAEEIR